MSNRPNRLNVDLGKNREKVENLARQLDIDAGDIVKIAVNTQLAQIEAYGRLPIAFARRPRSEQPATEGEPTA